jgi:antitoxin component YwqK of YwqJK toxin-antitoxin module
LQVNCVNGKRNGFCRYWDNSGQLYHTLWYDNGLRQGQSIFYGTNTYSPDHDKLAEMNYSDDKLNGTYIAWDKIGQSSMHFLAEKGDFEADPPTWGETYKIEGCFKDGNPDGMFKYWFAKNNIISPSQATNTYSRKIWNSGQLIDDGWIREGGWVITFQANGNVTPDYENAAAKYGRGERFTKKYTSSCDDRQTVPIDNNDDVTKHHLIGNWVGIKKIEGQGFIEIGQIFIINNDKTCEYKVGTNSYQGSADIFTPSPDDTAKIKAIVQKKFSGDIKISGKGLLLTIGDKKETLPYILFSVDAKQYAFAGTNTFFELRK